jgi:hypothetical protein
LSKFWNFWHYSDNFTLDDEADRLCKITTILGNLVEKFRKHCKPPQELDEAMITWQGRLRFRMYNSTQLVKYGILAQIGCEATTGYIVNMEIYTAEGSKLQGTIISVLEPYLN